jgi:hypothetical protein
LACLGNTPRNFFDFRNLTCFVALQAAILKKDFCHLKRLTCS